MGRILLIWTWRPQMYLCADSTLKAADTGLGKLISVDRDQAELCWHNSLSELPSSECRWALALRLYALLKVIQAFALQSVHIHIDMRSLFLSFLRLLIPGLFALHSNSTTVGSVPSESNLCRRLCLLFQTSSVSIVRWFSLDHRSMRA